jgi:Fe2+ or Zn2+ uptake regulation protein
MREPETLQRALRERGMRMTPQRRLVFRILWEAEDHPTAEEVFRRARRVDPGVSLATIYNILETLARMGEIRPLPGADGVRRYDPNPQPHHHVRCLGCGALEDVPCTEVGDLTLPRRCRSFVVEGAHLELVGWCPRCRRRRRGAGSARKRRKKRGVGAT